MAILAVDFSGLNGLSTKHNGDLYSSTAQPHLRYLASEGQFAMGSWNPFKNYGYTSPAVKTVVPLTGTITDHFVCGEYDSKNSIVWLGQAGIRLGYLNGFDSTTYGGSYYALTTGSVINDTELYQINGVSAIFYTHRHTDTNSTTSNLNLGWRGLDSGRGGSQLEANIIDFYGDYTLNGLEISSDYGSFQKLAQRFNTSDFENQLDFSIGAIRLGLKMPFGGSAQAWTLKVSIQTSSAGSPSGTIVTSASQTLTASSIPVGEFTSVYFNFASIPTLTADTEYFIVLEPTVWGEIGSNEGVQWLSTLENSNAYTDGIAYGYNGSAWVAPTAYDACFDFSLIVEHNDFANNIPNKIADNYNKITLDDSGSNYTASGTTLSTTVDVNSSVNPAVIVGIRQFNGADNVTSVTCGGVEMTRIGYEINTSGNAYLSMYVLTGMTTGTKTITVTTSGAIGYTILAKSAYGVHQTLPTGGIGSSFYNTYSLDADNDLSYTTTIEYGDFLPTAKLGCQYVALVAIDDVTAGDINPIAATGVEASGNDKTIMVFSTTLKTTDFTFNWYHYAGGLTDWASMYIALIPAEPTKQTDRYSLVDVDDNTTNFMCKADNGFLYWFTGNQVHSFDGGISGGGMGRLTTEVLLFPSYMRCIDSIDTNGLMYIGVQSGEKIGNTTTTTFNNDICGVYIWDKQTTVTRTRDFIPLIAAKQLIRLYQTRDGDIRVIVINNDRQVEIRTLVNSVFQTIYVLGIDSYPEYRDSLTYINNYVAWQAKDGKIWINGKATSQDKEGLFLVGDLAQSVTGAFSSGILMNGDEPTSGQRQALLASYKDGSTNKLAKFFLHAAGTTSSTVHYPLQGDIFTPVYYLPTMSTLKNMTFYCIPGTNATTDIVATLKFYFNQSQTAGITKTVTKADVKKGYITVHLNKPYTNSVQVELEYNTAMALSVDDFCPSTGILEYEPTSTSSPSLSA